MAAVLVLGPPTSNTNAPGQALGGFRELSWTYFLHIGAWAVAGALALMSLDSRQNAIHPTAILRRATLRWYTVFGGFALVSTLYSVSPFYTAFFAVKLLICLLFTAAFVVRFEDGARALLKSILVGTGVGWALVALGYIFLPSEVGAVIPRIGYRLTGGLLGDYGSFAALTGLGLLRVALYGRRAAVRLAATSGYMLSWVFVVLSRTRSTVLGAAAMLIIMLLLHPKLWFRIASIYGVGFIGLVIAGFRSVREPLLDFLLRGQGVSDVVSGLSGRRDAFEYGLQVWEQAPWVGFGFGAGSTNAYASYSMQTGIPIGSAHDALSKILLDLGLIGLSILGLVVLAGCRDMIVLRDLRARPLRPVVAPFIALFVWSLSTSVVSGGIADVSIVFVASLAGAARLVVDRKSELGTARANPAPLEVAARGLG